MRIPRYPTSRMPRPRDLDQERTSGVSLHRSWCGLESPTSHDLDAEIAQESMSYNLRIGTWRGLHFQRPPHEETKVVRCTVRPHLL